MEKKAYVKNKVNFFILILLCTFGIILSKTIAYSYSDTVKLILYGKKALEANFEISGITDKKLLKVENETLIISGELSGNDDGIIVLSKENYQPQKGVFIAGKISIQGENIVVERKIEPEKKESGGKKAKSADAVPVDPPPVPPALPESFSGIPRKDTNVNEPKYKWTEEQKKAEGIYPSAFIGFLEEKNGGNNGIMLIINPLHIQAVILSEGKRKVLKEITEIKGTDPNEYRITYNPASGEAAFFVNGGTPIARGKIHLDKLRICFGAKSSDHDSNDTIIQIIHNAVFSNLVFEEIQ